MNISERNTALDITRIVAFFSVICVHFFLNTEYYVVNMVGLRMLLMSVMRTGFMICVPLFIILSGYLMSRKKLSLKYYKGIVKTLGVYLLASIACLIYKKIAFGEELSFSRVLFTTLDYTAANYAWYIEMYIGLFLLVPFLNILYNELGGQKRRFALVLTFLALTTFPSIVNTKQKILPDFFTDLYPITYYFIGAYLRDYPIKIKKWLNLLVIAVSTVAFGLLSYFHSYGGPFKWTKYNDWFGFTNVIIAVFVFAFLSSRQTRRFPKWVKTALAGVADVTLGAYLVSYIFDSIIYKSLNAEITGALDRIYYFIPAVVTVGVLSLLLSAVINFIWKGISAAACKLWSLIPKRVAESSGTLSEAEMIIDRTEEKATTSLNKE